MATGERGNLIGMLNPIIAVGRSTGAIREWVDRKFKPIKVGDVFISAHGAKHTIVPGAFCHWNRFSNNDGRNVYYNTWVDSGTREHPLREDMLRSSYFRKQPER